VYAERLRCGQVTEMSRHKVVCVVVALVAFSAQIGLAQAGSSASADPRLQVQLTSPRITAADSALPAASAAGVSSSVSEADAPAAPAAIIAVPQPQPAKSTNRRVRPFSRIAIGTKSGTLGLGGQIATPLARWLTLRGGADFFSFGLTEGIDGATYGGQVALKSGLVCVDVFPFGHGLHISPGILIFKSAIGASMNVPGGNSFSMGDSSYTSDPNDPVTGSGNIVFSRSIMPSLTLGFGNMITRKERGHWSVPFEVGAAYTGHYAMQINLAGSACSQGVCQSTSNASIQQSVTQEQNGLTEASKHYQLYPIISSGVAYRF
jgi:hypothetical protein